MNIKYLLLPALILITAGCVQTKQADYSKPLQDLVTVVNALSDTVRDLAQRVETLESQNNESGSTTVPSGWNVFTNDQYKIRLAYPQNWSPDPLPKNYSSTLLLRLSPQSNRTDIAPDFKNYIVDVSIVSNKDNLTPQGIFDREYDECLTIPDNDFGCPRTSGDWKKIMVGTHTAYRAALTPSPILSNAIYIQQPGYYITIHGINYLDPYDPNVGSDLDQTFETILSTVTIE